MVLVSENVGAPDALDHARMRETFMQHITDREFPCVGAKSALATDRLQIETCWNLTSAWNDVDIHGKLLEWSVDYAADPSGLRSFVVIFSGPRDLNEVEFEKAMWDRLQSLAAKDDWRGQRYSDEVSSDPTDPHFSLSFGGQAYFVVGMHPNASRPARRSPFPTLVFNLHDQFEALRRSQRYERMRTAILERDRKLAGSLNPMLARHGEASEARQYSGRAVGDDWSCPFADPRAS